MKTASLYWIRLATHTDVKQEGYLGVSQDYIKRFNSHIRECKLNTHPNNHLVNAFYKHGEDSLIVEEIYRGDEDECYRLEESLRPKKGMGWNIAPGGHKGPGRVAGTKASNLAIERGKLTRKLRDERIASGNLTEDDKLYVERKKERKRIAELKKQYKDELKRKEKERKKKERLEKKKQEKIQKQKRKNLERTRGVAIIEQQPRPVCKHCEFALAKPNGKSKHGFQKWHKYCEDCAKALYSEKHKHLADKKSQCEECGFTPVDRCQLDLIYLDGDKNNKSDSNLKTMCANCSRLHKKKNRTKKKSVMNVTVDADVRIS